MTKLFKPFKFSESSMKNIFINNILWGVLIVLNLSLVFIVSKNTSPLSEVAGIKSLPIFIIFCPLLWSFSILWAISIKLFDKFKYNMLSLTVMLVLAMPLYLFYGLVGSAISFLILFFRFKTAKSRAEVAMKLKLREEAINKKNAKKSNRKNKRN